MIHDADVNSYILGKMGMTFKESAGDLVFTAEKGGWTGDEYLMQAFRWACKQPFWGHFKEDVIGVDCCEYGPLKWPIDERFLECKVFIQSLYDYLVFCELLYEEERRKANA